MNRQEALRYLLLRRFEAYRDQIGSDRYRHICRSFAISKDDESYTISWDDQGKYGSRRFGLEDFQFYVRGDTQPLHRDYREDLKNKNDAIIDSFLHEALGFEAPVQRVVVSRPRSWGYFCLDLAMLVGLALVGGLDIRTVVLLAPLFLLEFLPKGRLWVSAWSLAVSGFIPLSSSVMCFALPYAIMQFLDPDPQWRTTRTVISLAAFPAAFATWWYSSGEACIDTFIMFMIPALVLTVARSFFLTHVRAVPLVAPFISCGLALNCSASGAIVVLLAGLAGLVMTWLISYNRIPPLQPATIAMKEKGNSHTRDARRDWELFWASQFSNRGINQGLLFIRTKIIARAVRYYTDRFFPEKGVFLEAGSGSSQTSILLRGKTRSFYCLDFSTEALTKARTIPTIAGVVQGNIFALPFGSNSLDGIWNLGVMEHFTDQEIGQILSEFARVLKPGAHAVLFWPPLFGWYKFVSVILEKGLGFIKGRTITLYPDEINLYRSRTKIEQLGLSSLLSMVYCKMTRHDLFTYKVIVFKK